MTLKSICLATTALALLPVLAAAGELKFAEVPFASDDAAKRQAIASDRIMIDGAEYPIGYNVLARSGDVLGGAVFGALVDQAGAPLMGDASTSADFTSLLQVGGKLYSVTHFESRPGAMYLTELAQAEDGTLTAVSTKPVEFADVGGLWVPCAGSVTPWGSHLGSEEYPPDAEAIEKAASIADIDDYAKPMARYFGVDPETMDLAQFNAVFNPYAYGYPTEITVAEDGSARAAKHYAMGRVAVELAYVMPDAKTAYISDDGTNVGLFRFVADTAGDLSAGTLYAAKWIQTSGEGAGAADLEWIDLGHASDADMRAAIDARPAFSDLFEVAALAEDGTCADGFAPSNAEGTMQCLKVRDGMDAVASRLETRRYASMKGATTEFRKMEGITHNPDTGVLYLAMSEVAKAMTGGYKTDLKGNDAVQLAENGCGAVYELALDQSYTATTMKTLVAGVPTDYAADAVEAGNTCDINGIANPDNITYIPGYNTLIIGEDTGSGHQNDAIWAMDLATGGLTRIFSTPYGSETTSPYFYPNINGHAYLVAVVQHPYGESDEDKLIEAGDARAYVGYVGPMPAMGAALQ